MKVFILFIACALGLVHGQSCPTDKNRELYQNLCGTGNHKIAQNIDEKWIAGHTKSALFMEFGNDVARLHIAEVLKGKLLTYNDDYSDMCAASKIQHGEGVADGIFYGFGDMAANWKCLYSKDDPGVLLCDFSSSGLSKYKDKGRIYVTYTDNDKLIASVVCFPNGEVGWMAASSEKTLPEKSRSDVMAYFKSLGFDTDSTTVNLFDDKKCADREYRKRSPVNNGRRSRPRPGRRHHE